MSLRFLREVAEPITIDSAGKAVFRYMKSCGKFHARPIQDNVPRRRRKPSKRRNLRINRIVTSRPFLFLGALIVSACRLTLVNYGLSGLSSRFGFGELGYGYTGVWKPIRAAAG